MHGSSEARVGRKRRIERSLSSSLIEEVVMEPLHPPPVGLLDKYEGRDVQPLYSTTAISTSTCACRERLAGPAAVRTPSNCSPQAMPRAFMARPYCWRRARASPWRVQACRVTVEFGRDPMDGLFVLTAHARVQMPGIDRTTAEELVRNTERFCPYTKMARKGIVNIGALATKSDATTHSAGTRAV
jgi:osmotically inducible protein OsmC